jgi:hypothetical protein
VDNIVVSEIEVTGTPAFRADFTDAAAGTYYWTVVAGCDGSGARGAWSDELALEVSK